MYQGTNTKAIRSQREIAAALVKLIQEKPYEKIQITDICEEAGLSRRTFYNLFDSKDEALWFHLQDLYKESHKKYAGRETLNDRDIIDIFLDIVEKNRSFYIAMVENRLSGMITDIVYESVSFFYDTYINEKYSAEFAPYYKAIFAGAFSYLILEWLGQEEPIEREKLIQLLEGFLNGSLAFPE